MFKEGSKGINANEHLYLKKMFNTMKVGTEIEMEFEESISYGSLKSKLKMNETFSRFGFETDGIAQVKSDGSLETGVEIVTNGRLLTDVTLFHSQYKKLFDKVKEQEKPVISARTGLHQHFVLQTDGTNTNLEMELNPLFFKNLGILFKNNLAGIFWLTSAIYDKQGEQFSMTRYDEFHKWKYLFDRDLNSYSHEKGNATNLKSSLKTGERYNALNVEPMKITNNKFNNFHIEFRLSDGAVCPAQIAIQNFMFDALIKCALELSLFGELKDENSISKRRKIEKYKNNPSGSRYPASSERFSDSTEADIPFLKAEAHKLVDMLTPFLDVRVANALKHLASHNISEMLKERLSADEIETILGDFLPIKIGAFDEKILKCIANKTIDITTLNRAVISSSQLGFDISEVNRIYDYIIENNIKI